MYEKKDTRVETTENKIDILYVEINYDFAKYCLRNKKTPNIRKL